jgi:primosomal protein N' (replication factor Y)
MVRIVVRGHQEDRVAAWAGEVATRLRSAATAAGAALRVLGPAPSPIARLRDRHRWHVQVHAADGPGLRALVRDVSAALQTPAGIAWIVDVDPVEML